MLNAGKWSTKLTGAFSRMAAVVVLIIAVAPAAPLVEASASANSMGARGRAAAAAVSTPPPTQIVAGVRHTCALTPEGGVLCWGLNNLGQLGNGTTTDSPAPAPVTGLRRDVMGLSLAGGRTCALTIDGRVLCWGEHYDFGGYDDTPVEIMGLGRQVIQVAVGDTHACVLTSAGSVLCWGENGSGQLGNGTGASSDVPVTAISSGAIQVAVTALRSCAVMTTGEVKCWGDGSFGQLGDGQAGGHTSLVPVNVLKVGGSLLTGATQVSLGVGGSIACALVNGGVQCWGANNYGQLGIGSSDDVPHANASSVLAAPGGPALSGVDMLATGGFYSCVHLSSGNSLCWGSNSYGALGDGSTTDRHTPVSVGGLPAGVTAITAGNLHSCAFTSWEAARPFWCWGYNPYGELGSGGTGNTNSSPLPVVDISGLGGGASMEPQIVAGGAHTCSFTTGGGLKCWGSNANGQLGDGATTDRPNPVDVAGLGSGVKSMALGDNFTCALLPWGRLKCWGENTHGQLGNGSKTGSPLPVMINLPDMVRQVAAGSGHTCILTLAGSVLCWGDNTYGQLGDGSTIERTAPVVAIASGAVAIGAGGATSCAVLSGGGLQCWGLGDTGQLGNGGSGPAYGQLTAVSVQVAAGVSLTGTKQVALGANYGCALLEGRLVDCWGKNDAGQLGQGVTSTLSAYAIPVLTALGGSPLQGATQVTAGGGHACVRMYTDRLKCWGKGEAGQLGVGTSGVGVHSALPNTVLDHYAPSWQGIPYLEVVSQVSAGGAHTCAFLKWDGSNPYRCWGDNSSGQLGDASGTGSGQLGIRTLPNRPYPNTVWDRLDFGSAPLSKIAGGADFSCALTSAGSAKCWGGNSYGQLGDGSYIASATPVNVSGLISGEVGLTANGFQACALNSTGAVKCWGFGGTQGDIYGPNSGVVEVVAGQYHACALTSAGGVVCWGNGEYGQLGNGTNTIVPSGPVNVIGLDTRIIGLAAGNSHTCALTSIGGVKCWGSGYYGQLGTSIVHMSSNVPLDVTELSSGVVGLVAGSTHTCALTSTGGVKCWGNNADGQLGIGPNTRSNTPSDITGLSSGVVGLVAGSTHTCALTSAGGVKCWGNNNHGQLGDGTFTNRNIPGNDIGLPANVTSLAAGTAHTCATVAGTGPLRCWGSNANGQLGVPIMIEEPDVKVAMVSRWLHAHGLVEDEKPAIISLWQRNMPLVIPAQPLTATVLITASEVISSSVPPPCTNCTLPSEVPVISLTGSSRVIAGSPRVMVRVIWRIEFPKPWPSNSLQSAAVVDEEALNLFHYVDGTWIPMLPCTGCSLDTTKHVLIATLDGDGIYALMAQLPPGSLKYIYLPLVTRSQ